jgi:hypothetical protein
MEIADCNCVGITKGDEPGNGSSPSSDARQCSELAGGITRVTCDVV